MTELYEKRPSGAKLVIMEGSELSVFPLDSRQEWLVGRIQGAGDTGSMVGLHSPIASKYHGLIRKNGDVKELGAAMAKALNGRGGGKPGSFQGSVKATREQIRGFFKK